MRRAQRGATAVEFALVTLLLLTFLLGIIDFSRMLFIWNGATEATRAGARYAVVCDDRFQQAAVLAKMKEVLPQVKAISMDWKPAGCTAATCEGVAVSITSLDYGWISPLPGAVAPVISPPPFSTYLTREVMRQDPNSGTIC